MGGWVEYDELNHLYVLEYVLRVRTSKALQGHAHRQCKVRKALFIIAIFCISVRLQSYRVLEYVRTCTNVLVHVHGVPWYVPRYSVRVRILSK